MKKEKELARNTFIIFIGTICTKLITFLLLPLYTGILSTEEYGIVDLLHTLTTLLIPIITLQVEQAIFRDLIEARDKQDLKKRIISNGVCSVVIQCVTYLLILCIIAPFIKSSYKIYLAINVIVAIFSSLFLQIARGLGDNKKYAIGSFINAFVSIIFNILFLVVIKLRVEGMLLGIIIGQVACMIYLYIFLKLYNHISFKQLEWNLVKKLWKYSIPLIPNAISWWVFSSADRVIVTLFLGLSMNGILSAASKFSAIYITLYNIFNMSWTESIALHINDKDVDNYFSKIFNIILKLFIAFACGMIAFMPIFFPLMVNKNYSYGYNIVPILILGSLFNVVVGLISVIYVAKKNTKAIANTSVISAILNIIIHLALIKFVGLYAAAISTFASYFIMSIYRIYDIDKKYFKIDIDRKMLLSGTLVLICIVTSYYINNLYLLIISMIISVVYAIMLNKKSIKTVITFIKERMTKER